MIKEDLEKILKSPRKFNIKISRKDAETLNNKLPEMTFEDMKSLREFLTVVPAISKKCVEMGYNENKKFGAFTIIRDTPHAKILEEKYGTKRNKKNKDLTLKANI